MGMRVEEKPARSVRAARWLGRGVLLGVVAVATLGIASDIQDLRRHLPPFFHPELRWGSAPFLRLLHAAGLGAMLPPGEPLAFSAPGRSSDAETQLYRVLSYLLPEREVVLVRDGRRPPAGVGHWLWLDESGTARAPQPWVLAERRRFGVLWKASP